MKHESEAFGPRAVEEWLLYCRSSCETISINIVGEEKEYTIGGRYTYSVYRGLRLQMDTSGGLLELNLDPFQPATYWLTGHAFAGPMLLAGIEKGSCRVQDTGRDGVPTIHLETLNPRCRIDAYKLEPRLVTCPLRVFGLESCEIVLEHYGMLVWSRRRTLPATKLRRNFVGSCRTVDFSPDPIGRSLNEITLIVAVTDIIVSEFMVS
jgi:hypothetical protein